MSTWEPTPSLDVSPIGQITRDVSAGMGGWFEPDRLRDSLGTMVGSEAQSTPEEIFNLWFGDCRPGSFVALGSRRPCRDGTVAPHFWGLVPVDRRQLLLPAITNTLQGETAYVGVNALSTGALVADPRVYEASLAEGKPEYYKFKNDAVGELCAVLIDLDVGRTPEDLTASQAVGAVVARALEGTIPLPSMIGYSGRGAYVLYRLVEHDGHPPRCDDRARHLYSMVTGAMVDRLQSLCADKNARRVAQWCKAPGTVDTKTGNRVVYLPFFTQTDHGAVIPKYRLDDLARSFDCVASDVPPALGEAVRVALVPTEAPPVTRKASSGKRPSSPWIARCRDLESLAGHRGGIPEGQRRDWCCAYGWSCLSRYRVEREGPALRWAQEQTERFNRKHCKPPLPDQEVKGIFKLRKGRVPRFRTAQLVSDLGVTVDEAERLDLVALVPEELRLSRVPVDDDRKVGKRTRRAEVEDMIQAGQTNAAIYRAMGGCTLNLKVLVCRTRKRLQVPEPVAPGTALLPFVQA